MILLPRFPLLNCGRPTDYAVHAWETRPFAQHEVQDKRARRAMEDRLRRGLYALARFRWPQLRRSQRGFIINPFVFAPATDPYFSSVVLLLHCDGTDGSTTFTDVKGHTVTANGNAHIETDDSKFGGASGYFDGTGDYLTSADSGDWNFGTGDLTKEMWINRGTPGVDQHVLARVNSGGNFDMIRVQSDAKVRIFAFTSGATVTDITSVGTVSTGTWAHIAWGRAATSADFHLDGTSNNTVTTNGAGAYPSPATDLVIGAAYDLGQPWTGYIDEVRITKGVARYTANFTPPSAAFPDS